MLNYLSLHGVTHKNFYLIFGCRTKQDLLYYEEMKELEKKLENFYYLPTLSREKWDGYTGYVHTIYEEICQKNNEGIETPEELKPASFYLCGWKAMIDDARKKIAALGYDRKSIHLELYG